ncbi:MAG TPA: hypothetical protein PK696_07155, partial [bacterium]|nr:hypothetical protein [bacterium]
MYYTVGCAAVESPVAPFRRWHPGAIGAAEAEERMKAKNDRAGMGRPLRRAPYRAEGSGAEE